MNHFQRAIARGMADTVSPFFFYFAYGSNLLRERLVLANPSAQFTAVGRLPGHELVFVGQTGRWGGGGVANIRQREDSEVWGVVWRMDQQDLPSLVKQESIYTMMDVDIQAANNDGDDDDDKKVYRCHTFQLRLPGQWAEWNPPSPQYKDVIVRGALQHALPSSYRLKLQAVQDNGFAGRVEVYEKVLAMVNGGGSVEGDDDGV